jgi:hypothetical protein
MLVPPLTDPRFRDAVAALDAGDLAGLECVLAEHPELVGERLPGGEGYFTDPYLLWFVAENPIRTGKLPANIVALTWAILRALQRNEVESYPEQADYALGLVGSGSVAREHRVQLPLIDLLADAGADPNGALPSALAHREVEAVERLLSLGADLTLVAAIGTGRLDDAALLTPQAKPEERQKALSVAALYGNPEALRLLLGHDVDLAAYNPVGFHAHSTPLHQAVGAGSLEAVQVLVEAGAPLDVRDRLYDSTPCGWAEYLEKTEIAAWLRSRQG